MKKIGKKKKPKGAFLVKVDAVYGVDPEKTKGVSPRGITRKGVRQ